MPPLHRDDEYPSQGDRIPQNNRVPIPENQTPAPDETTNAFFGPDGKFLGDYQGYFNFLFPGPTLTGDQLKAKAAELTKAGINIITNPNSGNSAWIEFPGSGGHVDVIGDYGGANTRQWMLPGTGGGQDGQSGGGIDPAYLSPYTTSFGEFAPGAYGTGGGNLNPPAVPGRFNAPTAESILKDPGYQFRADQGKGMLETSAAARGLLNSGGTLNDILKFGQQFASQEYGNVWDRDFKSWDADWNHYGIQAGANDTAYNRAWQQYQDNKKTFYDNQNNPFNKIRDLANIGAGAA